MRHLHVWKQVCIHCTRCRPAYMCQRRHIQVLLHQFHSSSANCAITKHLSLSAYCHRLWTDHNRLVDAYLTKLCNVYAPWNKISSLQCLDTFCQSISFILYSISSLPLGVYGEDRWCVERMKIKLSIGIRNSDDLVQDTTHTYISTGNSHTNRPMHPFLNWLLSPFTASHIQPYRYFTIIITYETGVLFASYSISLCTHILNHLVHVSIVLRFECR